MRGLTILFSFLGLVTLSYCSPSVECSKNEDCVKGEICKENSCTKNQNNKEKITESSLEKQIQEKTDESVQDTFEPKVEPKVEPKIEPKVEPKAEPIFEEPVKDIDAGNLDKTTQEQVKEFSKETTPDGCGKGMVEWQGKCQTVKEYCTTRFNKIEQKHIDKKYEVLFDTSGNPTFCKTAVGSYYLVGQGYSFCDQDGDGWVTLEAYRAYTSIEKQIKENARCDVREIKAIVYHSDNPNAKDQVQLFKNAVPLLETYRNDGGGNLIEQPIYTKGQLPVPKNPTSLCQADTDCKTADGEVCYIGYCIKAKRFKAAEINTFTKVCIKNIDLNDNQLDDATEMPSDTPTPKTEFKPLLNIAYFMELNYGYYQKDYNFNSSSKIAVYHIKERSRREVTNKQGLALRCGEHSKSNQADYWKYCSLKDDQKCDDGTGNLKKGLSTCRLDKIQHGIRSLFKCVVFDGQKDASQFYFHPNNYGLSKKYTSSTCSFKADLKSSSKDQKDVEFSCVLNNKAPDVSKNEVGWACVSFQNYNSPKDYLAGCINECTESKKVSGAMLPCGENANCVLVKDTYGKGEFGCKSGNQGSCSDGTNYCKWGKFDTCIAGSTPKKEICNGFDDDCDGKVDEDSKNNTMQHQCYTGTFGCTKKSDGSYQCRKGCASGQQVCSSGKWATCTGETACFADVCDGKDNDRDGTVDNNCPSKFFYKYTPGPTTVGQLGKVIFSDHELCVTECRPSKGEVMVGLRIWMKKGNAFIAKVQVVCAKITLNIDKSVQPYKYTFTTGSQSFGKECSGYNPSTSFVTSVCPQNQAVIGFTGRTGSRINQVMLYCAPILVTKKVNGSFFDYRIARGTITSLSPVGNTGASKSNIYQIKNNTLPGTLYVYNQKSQGEIIAFHLISYKWYPKK